MYPLGSACLPVALVLAFIPWKAHARLSERRARFAIEDFVDKQSEGVRGMVNLLGAHLAKSLPMQQELSIVNVSRGLKPD